MINILKKINFDVFTEDVIVETLRLKVNKSEYIAKSRQRYHKTFNNILLHVSNHALNDMFMFNYGTF